MQNTEIVYTKHDNPDLIQCDWGIDQQLIILESNSIYAIDCSPDGKYIAYAVGCIIKIYDPKLQKQIGNDLIGHQFTITQLKYAPDGKILASGSNNIMNEDFDFRIRLWDSERFIQLHTLKGHRWSILALQFSPDGLYLASGSSDKTLRIWNMKNQSQESLLQCRDFVLSVDYHPQGNYMAYTLQKYIYILKKGKIFRQLHGHRERTSSIKFLINGSLLISGSQDKTIRIWNAKSAYRLVRKLRHNTTRLLQVVLSRSQNLILSAELHSKPTLWSWRTGQKFDTLRALPEAILKYAFSLDDRFIVMGSYDKMLLFRPFQTPTEL